MNQVSKITDQIKISEHRVSGIEKKVKNIVAFKQEIKKNLDLPVTELLEIILLGAINLNSSDIHIEPEKEKAKIRIRIDGILQDVLFIDLKIYQSLLSRIKLLSAIKLNISDRPQDGRFSVLVKKQTIEIRASSLPAEYGESIVLRILDPETLITLEGLGLRNELLKTITKEIKKPNGMIIVTGPTGSGKTTTLYAFLKKIQNPEIKIITIEDPIEYHLDAISQTQVSPKKGYDFASGLKSVMRQDPDVILVGEIRDLETVKTALQAALTGHLVLTTLHTNDAAGTIARLTSLGAKISNVSPALNMIVAQRLVRKICEKCKKLKKPSAQELAKIKKQLKKIPKNIKIPEPIGCNECNLTGYKNRIGIFEMFLIDDEIEKLLLKQPSIVEIKKMIIKKGMLTMEQDGILKVLQGVTTIQEVERVMGE